jgi:2-polyprenyl-3-methyl-5-hydroxy-6-metoxy-1,4-benzoquinol methylase
VTDRRLIDPIDTEVTIQQVRLELYRDNLEGALEMLGDAYATFPSPRYSAEAAKVRDWLRHLQTREAYVAAYERYYQSVKLGLGLQMLDRAFRTLTGRRTRKIVERCAGNPEFRLLEREALALGATRVLDAGCGEGRMTLTLGARHPGIRVHGLEVSRTNVRIARRLNRFPNVTFHEGLIEEAGDHFPCDSFDIVHSFGVLEHVRDVDETITAAVKLLRPGGRFCLVVPMQEFEATGPLPEFTPEDTACHVRVFTERGLRKLFGGYPDFTLTKLPGEWRPGRYPEAIVPVEFGSFFVAFTRP